MSEKNRDRRTVARHGQLRSPGALGQLMRIVGIVLAVVLVSGVSVAAVVLYDMTSDYTASSVELEGQREIPPDIAAFEGGFNLLLVGVDTCEEEYAHHFGKRCDSSKTRSTLNDVNILVHVSDEPRKVTAVSFPRDTMLPIPSCTDEDGRTYSAMSSQPLYSAWSYGGLNCVAQTISAISDQSVDFAAAVTFGGVIEITDAIGGVEVCVENRIRDSHTGLNLAEGNHTVSGVQALQFLRTRYGVGDGSDLGRISNQQQYMSSLVRKLVSEDVLTDPPTLFNLARTGLNNVQASSSLTNPILVGQIALVMKDVPFEDIVFVQYPTGSSRAQPGRVVPNYEAAEVLWTALAENKSLEITSTHQNDGVVVREEEPSEAEGEQEPDVVETESPAETEVVALPETVRGNSVAQKTCSNGRG